MRQLAIALPPFFNFSVIISAQNKHCRREEKGEGKILGFFFFVYEDTVDSVEHSTRTASIYRREDGDVTPFRIVGPTKDLYYPEYPTLDVRIAGGNRKMMTRGGWALTAISK